MKFFYLLPLIVCVSQLNAQNNDKFRAVLASEINKLESGEEIIVEYKKTGCWGDYEGGYLSFKAKGEKIKIKLINTTNAGIESEESTSAMHKKDLIAKLNQATNRIQDPDNVAINNFIQYNITKDGQSLMTISSQLEPNEVVNKVQLNPNFSDFFKQGKNNKAGILINN